MKHYLIGIDLGGTSCKFGLFDRLGRLHDKWNIPTNREENGRFILGDISDSLMNKLKEKEISLIEIDGIGLGVPGPVTGDCFVSLCANLGWRNKQVKEELEALIECPVKVANDANLAALGEMWQGSASGYQDLVMITLGTGVGGSVIVKGQMISGSFGAAGEIGHMSIVSDETKTCGCGKRGCLEQAASATGIMKEVKRLLEQEDIPSLLRNYDKITAKQILDAAKKGDGVAMQALERACRYLGTAMACITAILDPQIYLLGGGVALAGQIVIDLVKKHYDTKVMNTSKTTEIKLATLGNDAGIYGAAYFIANLS